MASLEHRLLVVIVAISAFTFSTSVEMEDTSRLFTKVHEETSLLKGCCAALAFFFPLSNFFLSLIKTLTESIAKPIMINMGKTYDNKHPITVAGTCFADPTSHNLFFCANQKLPTNDKQRKGTALVTQLSL